MQICMQICMYIYANIYWSTKELCLSRDVQTVKPCAQVRQGKRRSLVKEWQRQLVVHSAARYQRTVAAVQPVFHRWVDRGWESLNYHTTQVLTEYSCFGEYLCRITRADGAVSPLRQSPGHGAGHVKNLPRVDQRAPCPNEGRGKGPLFWP